MTNNKLEIGKISKPRFEVRTFGRDFSKAAFLLSRLSVPVPEKVWERTSTETYILSKTNDKNNTKIRDGKMDIKTLIQVVDGLEQWNPLMKGEFPIKSEVLLNDVFPAFMVGMPRLKKDTYSLDEFMEMVKAHPDLQAITVEKERYGYMVNDTICEFAKVWINGAMVVTVNSESTEPEDIKATIAALGLEGVENINYLQAAKRVIGMIDKKLAN